MLYRLDEHKKRYILNIYKIEDECVNKIKKITLNINKESFFPQSFKSNGK
jgi:hypothetical protein